MNIKKILCVPKSLLYNLAIFGWGGKASDTFFK